MSLKKWRRPRRYELVAQIIYLESELADAQKVAEAMRLGMLAALDPFQVEAMRVQIDLANGDPAVIEATMRAHLPVDAIDLGTEVVLPGRFDWDALAQAFLDDDQQGGASGSWND